MALAAISSSRFLLPVTAVALVLLLGASRIGAFTKVEFKLKKLPKGSKFIVKGHRGEYRDAKTHVNSLPGTSDSSAVIYWDDPRIMGKRCRFSVGIPCTDSNATAEAAMSQESGWTEVETEEDMEALYCAFPYTGPLSAIVAAIRVYPQWVEETLRLGKGHGPIVKITPAKSGGFIEFYFLTMPPASPSSFMSCMSSIA